MKTLYIHIPFCRKKCAYCDFLSFPIIEPGEIKQYITWVERELVLHRGEALKSIYIGGGTPSVLDVDSFIHLLECIHKSYNLSTLKEFTIEANPESLTDGKLETWLFYGVNRVSLGVQSFNDGVLEKLNRVTRRVDTIRAMKILKNSKLENINIDLIAGIQPVPTFKNDLKEAISLNPSHISSYMLSPGEGTKLYGMINCGEFSLWNSEEYEELYCYTVGFLAHYGYERYEISNFSKNGYESIHNLHYWNGGDYIGAGLGAVSTIGSKRMKNCEDFFSYCSMIERSMKPVDEEEFLDERIKRIEKVMLNLRTSKGIPKKYILNNLTRPIHGQIIDFIDMLEKENYVEKNEECLILTNRGIMRSNQILSELFGILDGVYTL